MRSRCSASSRSGVFRSAVAALLSLLVTGLELSLAIDSFATSDSIFIKELGIGTALAVLIDATIVRAFLVPSLMALLGHRYWWAPRWLRRVHDRIGLSEGDPTPAQRA